MAALRLFTRSKLSTIILRSFDRLEALNKSTPAVIQVQKRWSTYKSSPIYKDPSQYTDYEVVQNPPEWEFVERLLKPKVVPVPPLENKNLASGWTPPVAKPGDYPYHIHRTRNFMIPVYLEISFRGMRRLTCIRKINGNIWELESQLKKYLVGRTGKPIGVRVNELIGEIKFRGDYVSLVKDWLHKKGF